MSHASRLAIVLTSHDQLGTTGKKTGYYLPEAAHAWAVFTAAGHEVVFVSPRGGAAPLDPGGQDRADADNARFLDDPAVRAAVAATQRAEAIDPASLGAVFFAGGHGTMWDFRAPALAALAAGVWTRGGIVAAVCHGPAALVDVEVAGRPLVAGQPVTGFSNLEEEAVGLTGVVPYLLEDVLVARGGRYSRADAPWAAHVAIGERLVTGQNPASTRGVAEAVVRGLR
ncbi:MAG: type 1 glutamine amidotransferase domain-containing protein [Deltaproteobacteria bacterium]|nr:type 1 glutamine amidotransferase domain-containing protein [Deltaproteobacteria bacterium]